MIAEAVKHMLAAGMSPEAIVDAIREMEDGLDRRSSSAKRQQRYRDRNKGVTLRNNVTERNDISDKEIPPTPPKEINTPVKEKPPKGVKKKKHPLPESFCFSENVIQIGKSVGLSDQEIQTEQLKFHDWAKSNGVSKLDWEATARNWVRNARPNRKPNFNQGQTNDRHSIPAALDRLQHRLEGTGREDFSTGNGIIIDGDKG